VATVLASYAAPEIREPASIHPAFSTVHWFRQVSRAGLLKHCSAEVS